MNKPNILFLANTAHHTRAVTDHIKAISSGDKINWYVINPVLCKTLDKLDLAQFDAIGLHYSIKPYDHYYLSSSLKKRIASFKGLKFLFLQDEYQKVNLVQEFLYTLDFRILFTLVDEKILEKAYPDPRLSQLKKITVLTGYVQEEMKAIEITPLEQRPIDVSYRGRHYDWWLGCLAQDKENIASQFTQHAQDSGLKIDISLEESDRVYGNAWMELLKNSKAVLGTESGASIWDFDGQVPYKTKQYLRKNKYATFTEVYEAVLKPYDGAIVYKAISPRVFEAAATRTAMVMFPGDYSGVCSPNVHYIVLEKDFSNMKEVLSKLQDTAYLKQITDRAYQDLIESGLYSQQILAELVSRELLANLPGEFTHCSPEKLINYLDSRLKKYKLLNTFRCFYTESYFITVNLLRLLFAPEHTFWGRMKLLINGIKRYFAYVLPRLG